MISWLEMDFENWVWLENHKGRAFLLAVAEFSKTLREDVLVIVVA